MKSTASFVKAFIVSAAIATFGVACDVGDEDEFEYEDESYASPGYRCYVYKKGDKNYTWDYDANSDESHDWTEGKDGGTYKTTCSKVDEVGSPGQLNELEPDSLQPSAF